MPANRAHVLAILLALVSFATSAPQPYRPRAPVPDLRRSSLVQIDDDEAREILPAVAGIEDDDDDDDAAEDEEGSA